MHHKVRIEQPTQDRRVGYWKATSTNGKRPDTLVPWQSGKSLCWDMTVTCPLAESYIERAALEAGAAAEMAAIRT